MDFQSVRQYYYDFLSEQSSRIVLISENALVRKFYHEGTVVSEYVIDNNMYRSFSKGPLDLELFKDNVRVYKDVDRLYKTRDIDHGKDCKIFILGNNTPNINIFEDCIADKANEDRQVKLNLAIEKSICKVDLYNNIAYFIQNDESKNNIGYAYLSYNKDLNKKFVFIEMFSQDDTDCTSQVLVLDVIDQKPLYDAMHTIDQKTPNPFINQYPISVRSASEEDDEYYPTFVSSYYEFLMKESYIEEDLMHIDMGLGVYMYPAVIPYMNDLDLTNVYYLDIVKDGGDSFARYVYQNPDGKFTHEEMKSIFDHHLMMIMK